MTEVTEHTHTLQLLQSCPTLCDPMDYGPRAPLSMGFPRQEYQRGLPFSSPGDLPNSGIEPESLMSPALAGGFMCVCVCMMEY